MKLIERGSRITDTLPNFIIFEILLRLFTLNHRVIFGIINGYLKTDPMKNVGDWWSDQTSFPVVVLPTGIGL